MVEMLVWAVEFFLLINWIFLVLVIFIKVLDLVMALLKLLDLPHPCLRYQIMALGKPPL